MYKILIRFKDGTELKQTIDGNYIGLDTSIVGRIRYSIGSDKKILFDLADVLYIVTEKEE